MDDYIVYYRTKGLNEVNWGSAMRIERKGDSLVDAVIAVKRVHKLVFGNSMEIDILSAQRVFHE